MTAKRDQFARESARRFDTTILAPAERVLQRRRTGARHRFRTLIRRLRAATWLPSGGERRKGAPKYDTDRARDAHRWERAARFYLDALEQDSEDPAIGVELSRALEEAGKESEAKFAHRVQWNSTAYRGNRWPGTCLVSKMRDIRPAVLTNHG